MNEIAPFNKKQISFYMRSQSSWFNVCEGGKRGGKNVLDVYIFCRALEYHKNKIHLAAGVSITTARLNILDCDGFGLTNYFEGRYKEGKYKDRTCLYVNTLDGQQKVILVSGGGKKGDEKLIKGNTYGMAIVTEANECHIDFIREVFDRTLSSYDRKVFHDLNPKSPNHWYYKEILEFHENKQKLHSDYGYNYGHFTIVDNMSLSNEKIRRELNTYDKNSIWYTRDILGKRITAEGKIYMPFIRQKHVLNRGKLEKFLVDNPIIHFVMGVDIGGSKSATSFTLVGITHGMKHVIILDEVYDNKNISAEHVISNFRDTVKRWKELYPRLSEAYVDSAEQLFVKSFRASGSGVNVLNARKGTITDRIYATTRLMAQDRFFVMDNCPNLIDALDTAVWDDEETTKDVRLDDGNLNVDSLDSMEYALEPYFMDLLRL